MYVAWQNPDGQATITFDGIEAKVKAELTLPADWSDPLTVATAKPDLKMYFQDNTVKGFDISPPSAFTKGDTVMDTAQGGVENIVPVQATDADLCTEKWYLSETAIACVEISGDLTRKRNTGDVISDIILDYTYSYQMHAQIGRTADEDDEALSFVSQTVDFTKFFDGAMAKTSACALLLAGTLYSLTF